MVDRQIDGNDTGADLAGRQLARSKPDPLPYLTGLERTGARAEKSVAFEDSLSGVRAAAAAGLAVVGLTTSHDAARLIEVGALFAIADFTDARIAALIESRMAAREQPQL